MNGASRSIAWAVRIYGAALVFCPRTLRQRYGDEMRDTFAARCRLAADHSHTALVGLLGRELADLARTRLASSASRRLAPAEGHTDPRAAIASRFPRSRAVSSLLQDVRYALRLVHRQPGFTAVAVVTLALGAGATTAVFTIVNSVLLRPLPYAEPDRLVQLLQGRNGRLSLTWSVANYRDITTESGVFSGATAITPSAANLTGVGDPQQLDGARVTPSFFSVLGVVPRDGRAFVDADGQVGAAPVVIISDGLWRRLYGARAGIVGSTMRLDGEPVTIVGIAPPDLRIPAAAEFWRPFILTPDNFSDAQRGAQYVSAIARLKPGVDLEQAKSAMALVADRLGRDYPRVNQGRAMTGVLLHERIVRGVRPALLILLGAVTLVLLVACVNVANLLLARANGRTREVAVRAAVGAGRGRLVRQFLVESVVLGALGAVAGLLVAYSATRALVALGPSQIPRLAEVGIDWRVFAFALATALTTSVIFGLVPALASTGGAVRFISSGGRAIGSGGSRVRKALVVGEMALAVVLLIGAGLLIRSYQRISDVNPGFSPDHVLTFNLTFPEAKYPTSAAVGRFVQQYIARLGTSPGVESAAVIFGLPLDDSFTASSSFLKPGEADSADSPSVGMRIVTPDYFKAMRIPIRSGRALDARDNETAPEVVLINEEAAKRYWPNQNPIGQQMKLGVRLASGVRSGFKTIVGVVGNVKYGGLDLTSPPEVYLPYAQHPVDALGIVIRTAGDPLSFLPVARADLAELDRELPIAAIRTMDEVVGRSIAERRFTMLLLASFAAVAVLLAVVGVYGVLAYVVSQRTQEIGLRLAIGASPADVVRLFVREGVVLACVGLAVGLAGALAAARALTTLLFGVTARDPMTFATVGAALTLAAVCASYLPARRAARVDPMEALRTD